MRYYGTGLYSNIDPLAVSTETNGENELPNQSTTQDHTGEIASLIPFHHPVSPPCAPPSPASAFASSDALFAASASAASDDSPLVLFVAAPAELAKLTCLRPIPAALPRRLLLSAAR